MLFFCYSHFIVVLLLLVPVKSVCLVGEKILVPTPILANMTAELIKPKELGFHIY